MTHQPQNVAHNRAPARWVMAAATGSAILQNVTGMVEIALCLWMTRGRIVFHKAASSCSIIPSVIHSARRLSVSMTTLTAGRRLNTAATPSTNSTVWTTMEMVGATRDVTRRSVAGMVLTVPEAGMESSWQRECWSLWFCSLLNSS